MAKPYTGTERALLRDFLITPGFFLDLFTDGTSLHCSTLLTEIAYDVGDGVERDYEPMQGRWDWGDSPITMGADLNPEPLVLNFDASRVLDNTDFVGRFADSQAWHRRRARLTLVAFAVDSNWMTPVAPLVQFEGNMDFREFPEQEETAPRMVLTCESGTFRYLSRNVQTRTNENQQRFFPGDTFFQDTPGLIGREIPWHRTWVKTGGSVQGGSSGAGGGGSIGSGKNTGKYGTLF